MAETCFRCHGPDKSSRLANMRLDLREEATKPLGNGKTPIVPGAPEQSEILARIFATDARKMPPDYSRKSLTDAQKQTIRRWVEEGARLIGGDYGTRPEHIAAMAAVAVHKAAVAVH